MSKTVETRYLIHDDKTGDHIGVSASADGLDGLTEIYLAPQGKKGNNHTITVDAEDLPLLIAALQKRMTDLAACIP